jgi:hypothetical protein
MNGNGSNTKSFMAHELADKFKSKSDFIKYFKECLQLYLHPSYLITK